MLMSFRHNLQKYIDHPSGPLTLFYDDNVVIIRDAFPKSLRHYLILPRLPSLTHLHPLDAFTTLVPEAYEMMRHYVERAKSMMIDSLVDEGYLPNHQKDTFRNEFIRAGVHSIPSMANLHIHVISQDFVLPSMKNKKHYNSFTTAFFVDFDALAPEEDVGVEPESDTDESQNEPFWSDEELPARTGHERRPDQLERLIRNTPLRCTSCGAQFGLRFSQLKLHLATEYNTKYPGKACPAGPV